MQLKPYPEYKESDCPAVSQIPCQWQVHRCRYLFREVDVRSKGGHEIHLSMSQKHGLIDSAKIDKWRLQSESYAGGKLCKKGDLVLNRLKAHLGVFAHSKQSGIVSPDYTVLRPITDDNPRFFEILFKSSPFISEFTKSTKGIVKGFWRLYTDDYYSIRALVPPKKEQQQILRFIDSLTAQINKFIRNKRKQIELLQERRNALTYEAIKSQDTVWLRFGVAANQVERPIGREDELVYTPIGLFNRGRGIFHKEAAQGKELGDSTFFWVKPGDLVFSGQFAWEGAVAIAQPKDENCIASHRYPIFRNNPELVEAAYLYSFFTTKDGDLLLNLHSRGAAGRNRPLNPRTLGKEKIPIPPMNLQQEIARSLDLEFKFKNDVVKQISFIQEFRSCLIADIVTGKVDVRGIDVPEVVEEVTFKEEDDSLESVDLAGEDADIEGEE
jgi:type I restriction enzyme S subunit